MGRRKAGKRQANSANHTIRRVTQAEAHPTLFEAALRLPWEYGITPLASFLTLLVHAFAWAAHAFLVGLLWGTALFFIDRLVLRPVALVCRAWVATFKSLTALFSHFRRLFILSPSSVQGSHEENRLLRASLARLEKRVKRAEHRLKQQHETLQRLLRAPPTIPSPRSEDTRMNTCESKAPPIASAPMAPPPPPISAPAAPPPPPPPTMAVKPLTLKPTENARPQSASTKPRTAVPTPAITLKDLLRVKLKPSVPKEEGTCSANTSLNGSFGLSCRSSALSSNITKAARGLSVSLADITNVQLRRTHSTLAGRAAAAAGGRAAGSPHKVPLAFQLKRVEGIERSPGGTPIRPDIVKSSQNNTVDKFALALKKKFESSLISSPPRSTNSSPAASPIAPGTPVSLNGSFSCLSPSASFLDSSGVLSPIRPDKL